MKKFVYSRMIVVLIASVGAGGRFWHGQHAGTAPIARFRTVSAINGQIRQEIDYGGSFVAQAGWQWRVASNHLFRVGVQYFTRKSDQYEFFRRNEEKVGFALWYDY